MLLSPPNSAELKGNDDQSPTTELELPAPIISVKKPPTRKAPRRNHSEIERRRRERLNSKYNELRELVPACRAFRFARRGGDAGLHKLDILTEAVKYIEELETRLQSVDTRAQYEDLHTETHASLPHVYDHHQPHAQPHSQPHGQATHPHLHNGDETCEIHNGNHQNHQQPHSTGPLDSLVQAATAALEQRAAPSSQQQTKHNIAFLVN